jgi:outer membrane protein assembly factor BamB
MVASSIMFVALNVTTGTQIWNVTLPPAANNAPVWTPTYFKGVLYAPRWMSMAAYSTTNGTLLWDQWLGHQVFSSPAYADDLSGAKVYVGCDSYSITCFNATSGKVLSVYGTDGQVVGSPAIYDGKLYVGSVDHYVYCFDDSPTVSTSIWAESNKGAQMWSNETLDICGQLSPKIPNATVMLSVNKPDLSSVNVTTTTDNYGYFSVSYSPTEAGKWGWVTYYAGQQLPYVTYDAAYTEWNPVEVVSPPSPEVSPSPPPSGGIPVEYIYVAVAVIAIALIAIGAYAYTKRSKK